MEKLGQNLEFYYKQLGGFTKKTIYQVGIKLLDIYERIHESGFTYNDLKLDNILIGDYKSTDKNQYQIKLCDFGFMSRYRNKNGEHYEQHSVERFRSNLLFASVNQFEFKSTSRRDDLISLCYFLVYLFNNRNVRFRAPQSLYSNKALFKFTYQ